MAMEPSPVLVAIREDLARLETAAAASPPLDEQAMAELTRCSSPHRTRWASWRRRWNAEARRRTEPACVAPLRVGAGVGHPWCGTCWLLSRSGLGYVLRRFTPPLLVALPVPAFNAGLVLGSPGFVHGLGEGAAPSAHCTPFRQAVASIVESRYGLQLAEPGSDLWRERLAFRVALRSERTASTRR
jgi:hypothetical protein